MRDTFVMTLSHHLARKSPRPPPPNRRVPDAAGSLREDLSRRDISANPGRASKRKWLDDILFSPVRLVADLNSRPLTAQLPYVAISRANACAIVRRILFLSR